MLGLNWPPFLAAIFLLFWSPVFSGALTYQVQYLNFWGKRNDVIGWVLGMKIFFRWKVLKVGEQDLYRGKCVYLCNHRSWADFMVDQYATEGRSAFMSRWAVFFVFPTFVSALHVMRCVILFKRGHIKDIEGFNKWLDQQMANSPQSALSVYPEGHRSVHGRSLPLKRGLIKYAYTRKLPVQIVIGANKESILSEKHHTARFGQTAAVGYSEVILPAEYDDFELFMAKVQHTWDTHWAKVFSAKWDGLPELLPGPRCFDYPMDVRVKLALVVIANCIAFFFVMRYTMHAAGWALSLCGALRPAVTLAVVAYVAASFIVHSRPHKTDSMRHGAAWAQHEAEQQQQQQQQQQRGKQPEAADGKKAD